MFFAGMPVAWRKRCGMDFLSSIRDVAEKRAIGFESTIGSIVFMQHVADYGSRSGLESMVCSD